MVKLRVITDVVCPGCGCACDDIEVSVQAEQVVEARHACELGKLWFSTIPPRPSITVDGRPTTLDDALAEAAHILREARSPIVCGLRDTTCETARVAVRIADRLGAILDSVVWSSGNAATIAAQTVGDVTCSLGEIKNRADLIVNWFCWPDASHPRLNSRYAATTDGLFVPRGRADRTVATVFPLHGKADRELIQNSDLFVDVLGTEEFETLWKLRALVKGIPIECEPDAPIRKLAERMKACHFGVLFYRNQAQSQHKHQIVAAMQDLAQDLNAFTRFYVVPLTESGNTLGIQAVSTWQTGYPVAVNFNRGYPRSNPGEFSYDRMTQQREVDAMLTVSCSNESPQISELTVGPVPIAQNGQPRVCITTALTGLQTDGTVYRLDDVSLPLRPVLPAGDLPTDLEVLTRLDELLAKS